MIDPNTHDSENLTPCRLVDNTFTEDFDVQKKTYERL